jgi:prepilin-type N-terminal cleavage/methylation domain-containing protein
MEALARSNKRIQGYSLIEVLCALLLMTIALLAVMESVVLYTESNMKNMLRDEGVRVTQDVLYGLRSQGFDNVLNPTLNTRTITVVSTKRLRSGHWNFTTSVTVNRARNSAGQLLTPSMLSAQAVTSWVFLGKTFTHQASTLIPDQKD